MGGRISAKLCTCRSPSLNSSFVRLASVWNLTLLILSKPNKSSDFNIIEEKPCIETTEKFFDLDKLRNI